MISDQNLLYELFTAAQLTKHILQLSIACASSHNMRSVLSSQLQEYDMIETEILSIFGRRGWEYPEWEPSGKFLYRLRLTGKVCRTDSDLSERVILYFVKDTIFLLKLLHQTETHDPILCNITQKYLDRKSISVNQLQSFL